MIVLKKDFDRIMESLKKLQEAIDILTIRDSNKEDRQFLKKNKVICHSEKEISKKMQEKEMER